MSDLYYVTSSPHIKSDKTVRSVMRDVIIALTPAAIGAALFFSLRAIVIIAVSIASCVLFEFLYNLIMKKKQTIGDLSAVVTGLLLGFNMPVAVPIYLPVIGAAFAIIVGKMLYGGLGKNIANPALCGRIFLFLSFSSYMTTWVSPMSSANGAALPLFANVSRSAVDAVSTATPLSYLKSGNAAILRDVPISSAFLGTVGGCLGETSAILLILGGLYLIYRRVITWHIPISYLGTVALITLIFPRFSGMTAFQFMWYNLFSGGLMLGAIFMATDYATSPVTPRGRIIYGVGCGLLTVFIRYFGGYPEGTSFAILLMNFLSWFIDSHTTPKKFGGESRYGKLIKKAKE